MCWFHKWKEVEKFARVCCKCGKMQVAKSVASEDSVISPVWYAEVLYINTMLHYARENYEIYLQKIEEVKNRKIERQRALKKYCGCEK